ncbi:bleomycin resistance protein [Frigoribacterium sp. 2-23]|uniref:bleomycin resistance protein n=1 Tax=Frigoribacterium sp. 2-23 TaxID=3415006 RepID=UPI003C705811
MSRLHRVQPPDVTGEPTLVPELLVEDLDRSLEFWCGVCGFEVRYARPEERFAYIALGPAHLMLEQTGLGRNWLTGPLARPLGRGINFQIGVRDAAVVAESLAAAGLEPFQPLETTWYRIGDEEAGVRQVLVTDPDGYLVRFQSSLGRRAVGAEAR